MLFLRLLGIAPPGSKIVLEPLQPETAPHVVMPDYVAALSIDGEDWRIFHVEFFSHYRNDIPLIIARYGGSLAWQYGRPVISVLVLMKNENVPDEIPGVGELIIGETRVTHPFRTVRLWELDPEPVLSSGDPGLLPWALLMKLDREEAERLAVQIARSGNERWIARFLTLGGVRYNREELEHMLGAAGGGPRMGLEEAIVQGSSVFRHAREQAEANVARRMLRVDLSNRFPGLETMPQLDRIDSAAELESLFIKARSHDRDSMAEAILAAALPSTPRSN